MARLYYSYRNGLDLLPGSPQLHEGSKIQLHVPLMATLTSSQRAEVALKADTNPSKVSRNDTKVEVRGYDLKQTDPGIELVCVCFEYFIHSTQIHFHRTWSLLSGLYERIRPAPARHVPQAKRSSA
eukprot:756942-Hanusia_phi.AAC.3